MNVTLSSICDRSLCFVLAWRITHLSNRINIILRSNDLTHQIFRQVMFSKRLWLLRFLTIGQNYAEVTIRLKSFRQMSLKTATRFSCEW